MTTLRLVGLDPSLRNWGIAAATYDTEAKKLKVVGLAVVNPVLPTGKRVRQNSLDIEASLQLFKGVTAATEGAHAIFVEAPVGSQSARAMASYGICMGVLGAMRASAVPFFEVTATEVKMAGPGIKTATKKEMIEWAMKQHPEGNWPTYKEKGEILVSESKAEHMADAVAAIHAGIACNPFQQLLSILTAHH